MNMKHTWAEARYVHFLRIDDFAVTKATVGNNKDCIRSRCSVDGHDWEIRFYPSLFNLRTLYMVGLELALLSEARSGSVTANLTGRLVEYRSCAGLRPMETIMFSPKVFQSPSDSSLQVWLARGEARDRRAPGLLTVECTISLFRDPNSTRRPPSDLHQHLGDLLRNQAGADVTFTVSGESFVAHKNILAARSPVFMAEFFGAMVERSSQCVEIQDMDPAVFKAMLKFIYTDMEPELDTQPKTATVMAQHLLVAADRYGLDSLKVICEQRLIFGIDIKTAASTLALAEKHNCSGLKAKCIEFIAWSPENLDAILATEGYRHLEASSPSVLTELLKATNGRKRRSTDIK